MEATSHIQGSQQGVFDSVSEYHKERSPLASREISQQATTTPLLSNRPNINGVGLANTIRSTYQDLEKAKTLLSGKSIEQIKDFRSGLITLMLTFPEADRESLKPLLNIVSQAGKEKQKAEDQPQAPSSNRSARAPRVSMAAPAKIQPKRTFSRKEVVLLKKIRKLDSKSSNFAKNIESILTNLNEAKEQGLIRPEQVRSLECILEALKGTDQNSLPGAHRELFKLLKEEFPTLAFSEEESKNFSAKLFELFDSGVEHADSLETLCSNADRIQERVQKLLMNRNKKILGENFSSNYQTLHEGFEFFSTYADKQIAMLSDKKHGELDKKTNGRFSSVIGQLPYLCLSKKGTFIRRQLQQEFIQTFNASTLSHLPPDKFQEALKKHAVEHANSIESSYNEVYESYFEAKHDWVTGNIDNIHKVYNQYVDPSLNGYAACSMLALTVSQQLKDNPKLPSEDIDFTLTPTMIQDVEREHNAPSYEESKRISNNFPRHFDLEVRGALPVMSRAQAEVFGIASEEKKEAFLESYRENQLKGFERAAKTYSSMDKENVSTSDLINALYVSKTNGTFNIALTSSSKEENIGHDIVIQIDNTNKVFRLIDSNFGVIEYDSIEEFAKQSKRYLKLQYDDYDTFVIITYKKTPA